MTELPEVYSEWILSRIKATEIVEVSIAGAHGRVLAQSASAGVDLPLWSASAMDGYAIHSADTVTATDETPVMLRVIGEVEAGSSLDPDLPSGSAVRIMTGAPVPTAADAVIPVELTRGSKPDGWADDQVQVLRGVDRGANVRRRGEDVVQGETIAHAGEVLGAARLSALAAAGVASVRVYRTPRVAVVSTGSELREPGQPLLRGEIPESNSLLISGMLREVGIEARTVEHITDDAASLRQRLAQLAADHDAVITTGGVGPGLHDVVRIALEPEPEIRSVRVAVRPGQPQCSGRHSAGAFIFGLPGNPVSAAVSFELFVRPALRKMAGITAPERRRLEATATTGWRGKSGVLQVLPVTLSEGPEGLTCAPAVPPKGVSHSVGRHGATDGYALVEPGRGDIAAGDQVRVIETGLL
ncbi:gephyrin-like molybdotransferase Glp [Leucobacter denitrificans]|uniref:Molybdopterin molybdenumtransferase n=1 Tax=Leucobacter denitrificans TaxID=683042 RepID=A0A7G9S420_9MICO|nr:gephyrin-like molybdotransferase Glp [Leucobacter denitrificans]QNN62595.1 molybdopterin molybdotransferase MoeA [Leucobacter denitrificans]